MLRLRHSDNTVLEGIVPLDKHSYNIISTLAIYHAGRNSDFPICLEMKHINHNLSISFSIKMTGDQHGDDDNLLANVILEEQMALAFI